MSGDHWCKKSFKTVYFIVLMTHQIVIKLNEERFKPILDKLKSNGHGPVSSYSELVGKIIFFDYLLWTKKYEELGSKTKMNFLLEKVGLSNDELTVDFLQEYIEFTKAGIKSQIPSENQLPNRNNIRNIHPRGNKEPSTDSS